MNNIGKLVEIFNQGGIVIFPTDTAFGIGCRIDRIEAIEKLFAIRRRPVTQAVPVLVSSIEMAKLYWQQVTPEINQLMVRHWPGALTIVYRSNLELVPKLVRGGGNNVGLRMPDQNTILSIIEAVGVPILGPSANFHGEATPHRLADLDPELIKLVDEVIEGDCKGVKQVSTVVDCTRERYNVIRQGKITL